MKCGKNKEVAHEAIPRYENARKFSQFLPSEQPCSVAEKKSSEVVLNIAGVGKLAVATTQ